MDLAPRIATTSDIDTIASTIALAFDADPVWGPAFGGPTTSVEDKASIWRVMIAAAVRYPWSSVVADGAAVSIWIPPDGVELTEADEKRLESTLTARLGSARTADCLTLFERFEVHHPHSTPHAYLSLLATHPDHRGQGLGMALLADDLRRIDRAHLAAYLESTNPANDPRYESVGFERVGSFRTTDEQRVISTMERRAR